MFSATTTKLLKEKLPSPPVVAAEADLYHDIGDLVASLDLPKRIAVVDDKHTSYAFGDKVNKALGATHVTLEGTPTADDDTVEHIRKKTKSCDVLAAVGSGTINDLCKYAAHADGKPYIVFPTAASMNGYLSANASITVKGYKTTLAAAMPQAVFCDLGVIASAPARLSKAGLGDSLARPTAQADWLLSHLLLGTDYDTTPYDLLDEIEEELFDHARGIALADAWSIKLLVEVLLLSGLGMTVAKGSYPASQGEHMIAHAHGMLLSTEKPKLPNLHGEEIGITALGMARRQEIILTDKPTLLPGDFNKAEIQKLYGPAVAEASAKAFAAKQELIEKSRDGLKNWDSIAHKVQPVTISPDRLEAILRAAEAPVTAGAISWEFATYIEASRTARYLRERFTFLDLG